MENIDPVMQVQILKLQPHDILVFKSSFVRTVDQVNRMREAIYQQIAKAEINFPVGVLYLGKNAELSLLRPTEITPVQAANLLAEAPITQEIIHG